MKITSVTADWLHVDIPEDQQHVTDFGRISSFDTTLVRVETDTGLIGHGEARAALSSGGTNMALNTVIEKELGPLIIGEDPRQISRLWDIMYNSSRAQLALDRGHVFPSLGRRGITICGISGIDIALWDLKGKVEGKPVSRLLGMPAHDRLPAYTTVYPLGGTVDELRHSLDRALRYPVRALKLAIDSFWRDETDRAQELLQAARQHVGPDMELMLDAVSNFRDYEQIAPLMPAFHDCGIKWLEAPFPLDQIDQFRALKDQSIPVGAGDTGLTAPAEWLP